LEIVNETSVPVLNQKTFVKETALALWEGLPRVILAGVLFSAACFPALLLVLMGWLFPGILLGVLTVGPAWTALCHLIARVLTREPASVLEFLRAFARFYRRSLLLGGALAVPITAAALTLPALLAPPVSLPVWLGLGADAAGVFFLGCLYLYAFPIIVLYDVSVRTALRNSLILAARYFANTLGLVAMAVLLVLAASEISYLLMVILPAFWLVFVVNHCRMVVQLETGVPASGGAATGAASGGADSPQDE
jgi:uncharacterized membrane protein YesL